MKTKKESPKAKIARLELQVATLTSEVNCTERRLNEARDLTDKLKMLYDSEKGKNERQRGMHAQLLALTQSQAQWIGVVAGRVRENSFALLAHGTAKDPA